MSKSDYKNLGKYARPLSRLHHLHPDASAAETGGKCLLLLGEAGLDFVDPLVVLLQGLAVGEVTPGIGTGEEDEGGEEKGRFGSLP